MASHIKGIFLVFLAHFMLLPLSILGNPTDKLYKRAEKLFFQKKFSNAEALLKVISSKEPNHSKTLSLMGDIYLFQKEYHRAIQTYERATQVSSNPAIEHFRIGQCYLELKKFDSAKDQFQRAYGLSPKIKTALFQIGYIALFHERDKEQTIRYWEQFITEAPNDPQYEGVKRAIELLRDPNFKIPPIDSDISLQEALLLGVDALKAKSAKTKDEKAGDAKSKTNNEIKELLEDEEEL